MTNKKIIEVKNTVTGEVEQRLEVTEKGNVRIFKDADTSDVVKTLAICNGGVTPEQIDAWKKAHRKVHMVEIEDGDELFVEASMPLKRQDKIKVWLGYDDNLQLAFSGYITTLGIKTPIKIECEDEMFSLKNKPAKKLSYKSVTLTKILQDQDLGGLKFKVFGEQNIGAYRVTADTVSALLGHLKDNGVRSFIKIENGEPILYCGVLFPKQDGHTRVFATGLNLISDQSLNVQNSADVRIKLKAVSLQPNNKKIRVEVGDTDGEVRTVHAYNKNAKELKDWALQELERIKRDGLTGSLTTFGAQLVDKLDNVAINIDGERKGIHQVQKNVIKYGMSGFRQEITLGARVAE